MKKRILIVDDEPKILDSLRDVFRRRRKDLEITLAVGGEEAVIKLDDQAFEMIITDLRMPKMDGAELLGHVREIYPDMTRIMLTGFADEEAGRRATQVAHYILAKPCEIKILENVIDRSINLRYALLDPDLVACVHEMTQLTRVPGLFDRLTQKMTDKTFSVDMFIDILESETETCTKMIEMINLLFFFGRPQIVEIEQAVAYVGLQVLKGMGLWIELLDALPIDSQFPKQDFIRHGLATAKIAMMLSAAKKDSEDAFVGALLHDVGKLLLATSQAVVEPGLDPAVKSMPGGISHAEVGAYFLFRWGLPMSIVEAVYNHHHPAQVASKHFDTLSAVYTADSLVHELSSNLEDQGDPIDFEYLENLGVADHFTTWRSLTQNELGCLQIAQDSNTKENPTCSYFDPTMDPVGFKP